MTSGPPKTFIVPERLSKYKTSPKSYLERHKDEVQYLVAGTVVVHNSRILLIQRSRNDYLPLCWEVPGGCCDADDESIVGAACRETWEETGLKVTEVVGVVADRHDFIDSKDGSNWRKMTFLVEVEKDGEQQPVVTLDPNEHDDFFWVTEEDVLTGSVQDMCLKWTSDEQKQAVLDAFQMIKKR